MKYIELLQFLYLNGAAHVGRQRDIGQRRPKQTSSNHYKKTCNLLKRTKFEDSHLGILAMIFY
jgi:hypothetical protein